jgi:hypothetical protein
MINRTIDDECWVLAHDSNQARPHLLGRVVGVTRRGVIVALSGASYGRTVVHLAFRARAFRSHGVALGAGTLPGLRQLGRHRTHWLPDAELQIGLRGPASRRYAAFVLDSDGNDIEE